MLNYEQVESLPIVLILQADGKCSELYANRPGTQAAAEQTTEASNSTTTQTTKRIVTKLLSNSSNTSGDDMQIM